MPETITKSQFAARLGVSKPRISQMIKAGLPVRPDGRLDLAAALDWVSHHVDRSAPGASPRPGPSAAAIRNDPARELLAARAKKLLVEIRRAERRDRLEAGKLIETVEAARYAQQFSHIVRDALLSLPDRLAPRLVGCTDVTEMHQMLRADMHVTLRSLSQAIRNAPFARLEDQDE